MNESTNPRIHESTSSLSPDMRDVFFDRVYELAALDKRFMLLTADHGALGLVKYQKDFPGRYLNVGIAEQNMISFAAGLALGGFRVFVYSIINFVTLRCLEQISVDLSGMRLSVTIVGVGAGFTYSSDGPTHHGLQDVAAMASVPNLTIYNSSDPVNTAAFASLAYAGVGPAYIRIEKGIFPSLYAPDHDFSEGLALLRPGKDIMIIATGIMTSRALEVAKELEAQAISAGVIDLYRLKPLNAKGLVNLLKNTRRVVTLEEHLLTGGMGSMVSAALHDENATIPLKRIAIPDQHCFAYDERDKMQEHYGLGKDQIVRRILDR